MTILEDKDWSLQSDNAISKLCGVSNNFVSELRQSYLSSDERYEPEPTERLVERNGTTYTSLRTSSLTSDVSDLSKSNIRTYTDKRRAVMTILEDKDWSLQSDRSIASLCSVNHHLVAELRQELSGRTPRYEPEPTERLVERNGTTYTMKLGDLSRRNDDDLLQARQDVTATDEQPVYQTEPYSDTVTSSRCFTAMRGRVNLRIAVVLC